jgi:hypothetical protein
MSIDNKDKHSFTLSNNEEVNFPAEYLTINE